LIDAISVLPLLLRLHYIASAYALARDHHTPTFADVVTVLIAISLFFFSPPQRHTLSLMPRSRFAAHTRVYADMLLRLFPREADAACCFNTCCRCFADIFCFLMRQLMTLLLTPSPCMMLLFHAICLLTPA